MNINEIATKADIEDLKKSIEQVKSLLASVNSEQQKILRSADVRKMLNISDGTLQRLRITGTLPSQKINGTWFYKYEDVIEMLEQ